MKGNRLATMIRFFNNHCSSFCRKPTDKQLTKLYNAMYMHDQDNDPCQMDLLTAAFPFVSDFLVSYRKIETLAINHHFSYSYHHQHRFDRGRKTDIVTVKEYVDDVVRFYDCCCLEACYRFNKSNKENDPDRAVYWREHIANLVGEMTEEYDLLPIFRFDSHDHCSGYKVFFNGEVLARYTVY